MLNAIHSKWHSKTQPIAKPGPDPQQTTTTTTTKNQRRINPTTIRRPETTTTTTNSHHQRNPNQKKFIQLKAPTLPRSGRPILVKHQHRENREHQKPIFLKNYEILSQESLVQLLSQQNRILNQNLLLSQNHLLNPLVNQTQLLNQNQLLNQIQLLNQLNQSQTNRIQAKIPTQEEDQTTPIYTIISVPFLARSFLPTPSMKQKKLKTTTGIIKTKPVTVNVNEKDGQKIILCPDQENISAQLNLLEQQQSDRSKQLNITTEKSLNPTSISLNTTTRTPITTPSSAAKMMGIQLPGNEFMDVNGPLQIAAVEELFPPECLDDYFIETNNNSDFDTQGTYKLDGLNDMTINMMNMDYAGQLQPEDGQAEQLMKDVPGEEPMYSGLRPLYSEEMVSLTQPSFGTEPSESELLNHNNNYNNDMITNSEDSDNSSSYLSPGSPLPTVNDCIKTSELHNYTNLDEEETCCRFSPDRSNSIDTEDTCFKEILQQFEQEFQPNLKRNSDHLFNADIEITGAKKSKLNRPTLIMDMGDAIGLASNVPDTPEVCTMIADWFSETPILEYEQVTNLTEPKYENPPSIASSYICDEISYATPSPSENSSYTLCSTNPNSPAFSTYGSSSSSKKPRGRPPKPHSDLPDPVVWSNLPEKERKRYEDRCKNNEASRQSRQKNKEKQKNLQEEEQREQAKNDILKSKLNALERHHSKLKTMLQESLS